MLNNSYLPLLTVMGADGVSSLGVSMYHTGTLYYELSQTATQGDDDPLWKVLEDSLAEDLIAKTAREM